jgi:hypothetical protein
VRLAEKLQIAVVGDHRVLGEAAGHEVRVDPERRGVGSFRDTGVEAAAHVDEVLGGHVLLKHRARGLWAARPPGLVGLSELLEAEDRVPEQRAELIDTL